MVIGSDEARRAPCASEQRCLVPEDYSNANLVSCTLPHTFNRIPWRSIRKLITLANLNNGHTREYEELSLVHKFPVLNFVEH